MAMRSPQVLPAISEDDYQSVVDKISKVAGLVEYVHIDYCDGSLHTSYKTFQDLLLLKSLKNIKLELHVNVLDPLKKLSKQDVSHFSRIIVQVEGFKNKGDLESFIKYGELGFQIGLGLNVPTQAGKYIKYLKNLDAILLTGATPGLGGQTFNPLVYEKIEIVKRLDSKILISVDCGINDITAREAVRRGADILVSGSYIFKHPQGIKQAILELKKIYAKNS